MFVNKWKHIFKQLYWCWDFFRFNIIKIPTKSHKKNDSTFDKSKNIIFLNKFSLLRALKRLIIFSLCSLCFFFRRQFESAVLTRQNKIFSNDSIVAIWQFTVQSASEKNIAIVDVQDVRNWMLKLRIEANLNALEFRNFLINRSIRDRIQSVPFVFWIFHATFVNRAEWSAPDVPSFFNCNFGNISFVIATGDDDFERKRI